MARKNRKNDGLFWLIGILAAVPVVAVLFAAAQKLLPQPIEPDKPVLQANPYSAEDFVWKDGFLTCTAGESIPGIDVSYYQGEIDWPAVKAAGVEFAIIRVGYRGYNDGLICEDELARENLQGAAEAGLQVGAYFFSQALTVEEALEEAAFTLEILKDYQLQLPVVFDWEYVSETVRTGSMEPETLVACADAFCGAVAEAGYQPMVYFNQELSKTLLDVKQLAQYPFWFAQYGDGLEFPYQVKFWQYSDEGSVPGIEGNVDLDLWFP